MASGKWGEGIRNWVLGIASHITLPFKGGWEGWRELSDESLVGRQEARVASK